MLASLRHRLRTDTPIWVSWPKKSSKAPTTIIEDIIREFAQPLGFVDIKVSASGEMIRLEALFVALKDAKKSTLLR